MISIILLAVGGLLLLALLLHLHLLTTLALALCLLPLGWNHFRAYQRQRASELLFEEACYYMDAILYAFGKTKKIDRTIAFAAESVREGHLKEVLKQASDHMLFTFDESDAAADALASIEAEYPCRRIRDLHAFMLEAERRGGDLTDSVSLLLEDKNRWESRMQKHRDDRKKEFREIVFSVLASLVICASILAMPVFEIDISDSVWIQVGSLIMLFLDDVIIYRGQRFLECDYLNLEAFSKKDRWAMRLERYRSREEKAKKEKPLWLGVRRRLEGRSLKKQLLYAFPAYLIELALLLQSENVQVAIAGSIDQAPDILRADLKKLSQELAIDPESAGPYHRFLSDFSIPQIASAMSMLYTIASGHGDGGENQLKEVIAGNYRLLDESEKSRLREQTAGMYLLFLAPVLTASFMLIGDMAAMLFTFLSQEAFL